MRILKILTVFVMLALLTGCTCKARKVASNIPFAGEGAAGIGYGEEGPLQSVNFSYDSYQLDGVARSKLDSNVVWLNDNNVDAVLEGHCDERGTYEYNTALGLKRARTVYDYYVGAGIDPSRLSTISYGEELPIDPGSDDYAWSQNRRVNTSVR